MDTDPIPRSHRDRRTTPRRAEDVRLHYATELLIAAALCAADAVDEEHWVVRNGLTSAAEQYRAAVAAAQG